MDVFLCGPLADGPLRAVVLGRDVPGRKAEMPGLAGPGLAGPFVRWLGAGNGALAGLQVAGLTTTEQARLAFYAGVRGLVQDTGRLADGTAVQLYRPRVPEEAPEDTGAAARDLQDWEAQVDTATRLTAADVMAAFGLVAPETLRARYEVMRVRGASRLRALAAAPPDLRRQAGDVRVQRLATPYARFFAVEEYDLSFQRFDGTMSPVVNRAAFVSGDAVTVLPYDPLRDRVLLVEQFRTGPFARGDHTPWQLEAIAGRIDPGETPEACARREAVEEAGLVLGALHAVGQYYPSPGAKSEFIYSYLAICDLPDGAAGVFGMADEAEDIRGHIIGFDRLMALVGTGEVSNAPVLISALWLQRERARLRAGA